MRFALGIVIKTFRQELYLKQSYMAHQLSITTHAYANIESGRSSINTERLFTVAKILNIPPFQLVALTQEIIDTRESVWLQQVVRKIVLLKKKAYGEAHTLEEQFLLNMENSLKQSVTFRNSKS